MASSAPSSNAPVGPLSAPSPDGNGRAPAATAPPPPRPLGRRASLPGGRAVVGGLLVTVAALGTFVAYRSASAGPTATVVVADHSLAIGDTIAAADLRVVPADLPGVVQATLFPAAEPLDGAVVLAPIEADQAIARSAVSTAPSPAAARSHDLSFAVERERALNGRLRAGDHIDLVATFGTGDGATTELVARGVRVIGVDAPSSGGVGSGAKLTLTIALGSEAEVIDVANALGVAEVTVVRSTGVPPSPEPSGDDARPQGATPAGDTPGGTTPAAVRNGEQP